MSEYRSQQPVSSWASGGVVFAGVMLVLIGCFQSIVGLTAIFNDDFFASASNYTSTSIRVRGAGSICRSGSC